MNKVVLIGRLTKDPEIRYTQGGTAVGRFTLAVDRNFQTDGEKQADFIPVTVWRTLAENCAKYICKGRLVAVSGRIRTGSYEKDGRRIYTTEVVAEDVKFLEWGEPKGDTSGEAQGNNYSTDIDYSAPLNDDELPF